MKTTTKTRQVDLLRHLKETAELAHETGLSPAFFEAAKQPLAALSKALSVTPSQAALFAVFLNGPSANGTDANGTDANESDGLSQSALAEALKCGRIESMRYYPDIKCLVRRHFIEQSDSRYSNNRSWSVPVKIIDALSTGKIPRPVSLKNLSLERFFEVLDKLYSRITRGERAKPEPFKKLVAFNMHLGICKRAAAFKPLEMFFLLYFCRELVVKGEGRISEIKLRQLMRHAACYGSLIEFQALRSGSHPLIESGLVELASGGVVDSYLEYSLTAKARDELLAGMEIYETGAGTPQNFVKAQDIKAQALFYNDKEESQIAELKSLFMPDAFSAVRERLASRGRNGGFACLFYGEPGTGKTASAFEIARAVGRDIIQVDIAETKSMWFGKSEKLIKAVFDDYRQSIKRRASRGEAEPILLFNEADAVFSKRRNIGEDRSGPGQTENAIQNIILEEIETLSGILIATTNLTGNLDKAFERRFLYKIEFKKPAPAVRAQIWNAHIPELDFTASESLSRVYDFSGGQIGNIARKSDVQFILHNEKPSLERLKSFCDEELLNNGKKPIGFAR